MRRALLVAAALSLLVGLAGRVEAQQYNNEGRLLVNGKPWVLGQTTMAESMPVVLPSDQSALPVTGTFWPTAAASPSSVRISNGAAFISPLDSASFTTRFPSGSTTTDDETNISPNLSRIGARTMVFDGTAWDMWRGDVTQSGAWTVEPGNTPNTAPWLMSIHDGTTKAAVLNLAANDPLSVAIVDGSGSQITSFGGGVQYTEADTDASISGTAVMWEDTADTLRAASAANPLPVNVVAGGAGDGKILDGTASGQADVFDYTNSRPLAVRLTDTNGDYTSAGGGTQYVEFNNAAATPTGTYMLGRDIETATDRYIAPVFDADGRQFIHPQNELHETFNFKTLDFDTVGTDNRAAVGILLPASGGGVIGGTATNPVRVDPTGSTAQPVTGTFWQATQPVSGTFWQATQPVSLAAAVTVAQATAANLNATVTDGTGPLTVDGTVTVTDGAGALNVIVDSGTTVVTQGTGTNLHTVVDSGTISINQTTTANDVDVVSMPTTTVTATNLDVQIGGSDSLTIGTFPDNEPFNLAQVAGATTATGNGTAAGSLRVSVASDSTGTIAATQATASSLNMRPDTSGATGAAPPSRADFIGGLASGATGGFVIGVPVCDTFANVNVSTATTTLLVTGVSGRHVRICSLSLVTAAANNVALISGTGATCGTGTTGMSGGTTAATGWNFAANGGLTQGSGIGTINQTNATGDSVCVVTSAATQLSGRLSYTIY